MSYLEFNKKELVNLENSLTKEVLRTNRAGSFSCTTLIGCNTRKYHGLLVCPLPQVDGGRHVLLSSLEQSFSTNTNLIWHCTNTKVTIMNLKVINT